MLNDSRIIQTGMHGRYIKLLEKIFYPFSNKDAFWCPYSKLFLENMVTKEKLLKTLQLYSIMYFYFQRFSIVFSRCFQSRLQQKCCMWKRVNLYKLCSVTWWLRANSKALALPWCLEIQGTYLLRIVWIKHLLGIVKAVMQINFIYRWTLTWKYNPTVINIYMIWWFVRQSSEWKHQIYFRNIANNFVYIMSVSLICMFINMSYLIYLYICC